VSLWPCTYILATKSTVSATESTTTSYRIHVVADLLSKPATKSTVSTTKLTVSATVDFVADLLPISATVHKVDHVEFNFVASVYWAIELSQLQSYLNAAFMMATVGLVLK